MKEDDAKEIRQKMQHWVNEYNKWHNRETIWNVAWFFVAFFSFIPGSPVILVSFVSAATYHLGIWLILLVLFTHLLFYLGHNFASEKKREATENVQRLDQIKRESRRMEIEKFEREQMVKGLVKFVSISGHVKWGTPEQVREWKIIDFDMRNNFATLTPRQFEEFIAHLFQRMGYEVRLGPYVKDFGADVIAKRGEETIIIQVKKYAEGNKVRAQEVQQVGGALLKYKANRAIIITTTDFTEQAHEQARGTPIELWNHTILFELIERHILSG